MPETTEAVVVDAPPFNENSDQEQRFAEHWQLFTEYETHRNQHVHFLNKNGVERTILDYINDSVNRMNEYHPKPAHKEEWQNNVFDPITRDKLISILSKMATARMRPEVHLKAKRLFDTTDVMVRQSVFSDLLEHANIHNDDASQLIWEMYTALSEGTLIGYEGWRKGLREVEYVKEYDPDTGVKKTEKIKVTDWDDVFGEIVPIQEFYPESIWMNATEFNRQRHRLRCFRVREMKLSKFRSIYKKFANADKVRPASAYMVGDQHQVPWGISQDIDPRNVQVIEWYDAEHDRMGIWGNGTELYWGTIPFNHKSVPFWLAIAEPIHHQFLYGKSLPDKLMGMQDVNNATLNGMLDQLFLSLNSPVFIDGDTDEGLGEGYLEPGRTYKVDPGTKIQQANIGQVDQTAFQMLQLIKRSMEESSISAQAQGVPTGGRKTKFEVQQLQEGALNLAGLFLQIMENAMRHKYTLRMYNILQYYAMPSGKDPKTQNPMFKFITIDNRKLTNGKTGTRMIQIVGTDNERPNPTQLKELAEQVERKPFDVLEARVEPIVITRDYLMNREFEMEMHIVPNSSVKQSEADKRNKDIVFYQMTAQNPMVDQEANLKDFAQAFDKSEDIIKKPERQDPLQQMLGGGRQQQPGMPGQPGMAGMPSMPMLSPEL